MVDGADSAGPVDRLQNLLLDMTGRIDDDAVNSARELLGVGQPGAAAELLVGCLVAGGIPVTPAQQYHLRWVLDQSRSRRSLVDRLRVLDGIPPEPHRFAEADLSDAEIAEALRPVARRLTGLRALWCVARSTPAGVTYGAVPQYVLIAEVVSDSAVPAAGYQILEALREAGITCSVDVFGSGTDLPDYHRDALAVARKVDVGAAAATSSANHARAPRRSSGGEPAGASASDLAGDPPAGVPPAAPPPPSVPDTSAPATSASDLSTPVQSAPALSVPAPAGPGPASPGPVSAGPASPGPVSAGPASPGPVSAGPASPGPVSAGPAATVEASPGRRHGATESVTPESLGAPAEAGTDADPVTEPASDGEQSQAPSQQPGANSPGVPAAVDAKLTDRERNLLRKLHEELAQREQDRPAARGPSEATEQVSLSHLDTNSGESGAANQQDPRLATTPGTGGFPPIGASGSTPGGAPGRSQSG